jgi:hypothetical protein
MGRARDNRRHRDDGPRISRASLLTSHALVLMTIELVPPAAPVSDDVLSHAGGGRARSCLDDVITCLIASPIVHEEMHGSHCPSVITEGIRRERGESYVLLISPYQACITSCMNTTC